MKACKKTLSNAFGVHVFGEIIVDLGQRQQREHRTINVEGDSFHNTMQTVLESPVRQTAVSEPAPSVTRRLVSYAEYRELDLDDDYHYELLHGDLVKKSAPSPQHQAIAFDIAFALNQFCRNTGINGRVLMAPIDVVVDEFNVPQPDVLYVSEARREIITADGIVGAPDVVMEVISPSSISRDRHLKRKLYERLGVQEYWILDPNNQWC